MGPSLEGKATSAMGNQLVNLPAFPGPFCSPLSWQMQKASEVIEFGGTETLFKFMDKSKQSWPWSSSLPQTLGGLR